MATAPLMPKATAVWLVDNTSLTFEQIADFWKQPLDQVAAEVRDAAAESGRLVFGMRIAGTGRGGRITREDVDRTRDPRQELCKRVGRDARGEVG